MKRTQNLAAWICGILALFSGISASALPLTIAPCSGQGVTVTDSGIDWLPMGGPGGCIQTVTPTAIPYTGIPSPLLAGTNGTIRDIPLGTGTVTDFMTFSGHPVVHFDLFSLGPGVANANCADSFNSADPVCSIVAGSPFVVRPGFAGATITVSAFGAMRDGQPDRSLWLGVFSVDFAGRTPFDIQEQFLTNGMITSGYSASFDVFIVPESGSLRLIGVGLVVLSIIRRHRTDRERSFNSRIQPNSN